MGAVHDVVGVDAADKTNHQIVGIRSVVVCGQAERVSHVRGEVGEVPGLLQNRGSIRITKRRHQIIEAFLDGPGKGTSMGAPLSAIESDGLGVISREGKKRTQPIPRRLVNGLQIDRTSVPIVSFSQLPILGPLRSRFDDVIQEARRFPLEERCNVGG